MIAESSRQTLLVVSAWEGMPLNYSKIGKQLDISCPAAKARVQKLVEARFVRLLHPLETGAAGKSRKSPKLYLNGSARSLLPTTVAHEGGEIRLRSRMIRTVCSLEAARNRSSTFWYYGGYGKTHVELIAQTALKRIGFVFLQENRFDRWCWSYCKRILRRGIIQGGFVLYPGHRIFFAADRLVVLPAEEFCDHYRRWMNACLGSSRKLLLRMVRTYNTSHAGHLP
jgi:phage pi2 protein 07